MFKKYKPLIISILISLGTGLFAAFLTMDHIQAQYSSYIKPPLSPPGFVFGLVWTVLYFLMGISAYFVSQSDSENKKQALAVYSIQLIFNFFWPVFFFNFKLKLFSFFWILILIGLIGLMLKLFYKIRPIAAYLQLPYFFWSIFAAYLNFGIYLLNR